MRIVWFYTDEWVWDDDLHRWQLTKHVSGDVDLVNICTPDNDIAVVAEHKPTWLGLGKTKITLFSSHPVEGTIECVMES